MRSTLVVSLVIIFSMASAASAQVRDRPPRQSGAAGSDAQPLGAGWTALAGRQIETAVANADAVLSHRPWDRAALLLKITALAASTPQRSLDVYERWLGTARQDDPGMLEPIAIGVAQEIAGGKDPMLAREALAALAAAHVPGAREALQTLPRNPEQQLAAQAEAARGGDTAAMQQLMNEAAAPAGAPAALARALQSIGASGRPGLLLLLKNPNSETRAAAARALGTSDAEEARAPLQELLQDSDPVVRTSAVVSLAQLGDQQALETVDKMLVSPVPDVQLAAAAAWQGRPGPWVAVVQNLLDNRGGATRLEAAQLIAPVDPEAAKRTLRDAMRDPNPVIRYESSHVLDGIVATQPAVADLPALRQQLRDADPAVRLEAASALLKLART